MSRTRKIISSTLLSTALASGVLIGSSTSAEADTRGNRVIVSGYNYQNVQDRCYEKMRTYSSAWTKITQSCTYLGMNQYNEYGFAFWWKSI